MEKIYNKFELLSNESSDINEHMITFKRYAEECGVVTEMGVRWVVSTWGFLAGKPNKMVSYDIKKHDSIREVEMCVEEYGIDFKFHEADVLKIDIEKTDLLFIDTLHSYDQLIRELIKHSVNVNKYIMMHDTESFGFIDELLYSHASDIIKSTSKTKEGLQNAISDFLVSENGKNWCIHEKFTNNNGLMILKRIK